MQKDSLNISEIYRKIVIKEDLGLGPNAVGGTGTYGGDRGQGAIEIAKGGNMLPDNSSNPSDKHEDKKMAMSEVQQTIDDAMMVLKDLKNSNKVEAWVLTKLATVADRIQSVKNYLDYNQG